jgi:ribosome-associated protein
VSLEPVEKARIVVDLASDIKGENIVLMDMRQVAPVTDYFVIFTATSDRQLKAIIDHINQEMKAQHNVRSGRVEGAASNGWVVIDYGDVVVHGFLPARRSYYDLEGLWHEAPVMVRMQ